MGQPPPPTKYGNPPGAAIQPAMAGRGVAPPPTRFATAPPVAQPKRPGTPPPTRFATPPPVVQPKHAAAPPPPPTRFAAARAVLQAKRSAPPPAPAIRPAVIQAAVYQVSYYRSRKAKAAREYREQNDPGGCNVATVDYTVTSTGLSFKRTAESNKRHTEKVLYDWLEHNHYGDYTVNWLYTELETCGSDYHNCTAKVARWFPNADIYYSIDYPAADTVSTDDDDDKSDPVETLRRKTAKAKRRRKRSAPILKRLRTKSLKRKREGQDSGDEVDIDDFNPELNVPYSPYRDDPTQDPGIFL